MTDVPRYCENVRWVDVRDLVSLAQLDEDLRSVAWQHGTRKKANKKKKAKMTSVQARFK
jgi:hypothetical protein